MNENSLDIKSVIHNTVIRDCGDTIFANELSAKLTVSFDTQFKKQGDFVVAMLVNRVNNQEVFIGVSKRNPRDQQNPVRGKALALTRATRAYVDSVLNLNRSALWAPIYVNG